MINEGLVEPANLVSWGKSTRKPKEGAWLCKLTLCGMRNRAGHHIFIPVLTALEAAWQNNMNTLP